MSVKHLDWEFSKRGQEDVVRHQKKLKDTIRKNISDIIAEESIITRKKGQTIKVPLKGIKSYHFRYGNPKGKGEGQQGGRAGIGHGKKKKGEVLGKRLVPGNGVGKKGKPGDQVGEDYLEAEIDIEELVQMMMDDLRLPDLRKKEIAESAIPVGWTFDNIEKHGLKPNLDKRRTLKEALKREAQLVRQLSERTGVSHQVCVQTLNQAKGNYDRALEILEKQKNESLETKEGIGEEEKHEEKIKPYITNEDLRFRTIKEDVELHSNAVILAMMDVSGSMTTTKKYLARSFFFWMVEFLKHKYRNVEIRFIAHTTEAKLVDEEEFFHKGESGGTLCASAYDLASELIESDYPVNKWNIYGFHFSDGEDWDADRTMNSVCKLLEKDVNMLGYGEITTDPSYGHQLMQTFQKKFNLEKHFSGEGTDFEYYRPRGDTPFLGVCLKNKDHVYPALRVLFSSENIK